ncbi:YcxB-like protein [Filimonas lacunae]|uniref:YcxB-like protein n=1 Tax=Filimonas lacunae TaxID=477680 RepID=A0A1N7KVT8_9BACT|nr:YcxB family protein [Filimonas lacunae]SIS65705.1 YcxB-like protein [Filimonas lacunae]
MQVSFSYDKKKVIQGLRYHFMSRAEIRIMVILVNVFAIIAAILFYSKKIRPEPFLLGSCIWIFMMLSFWFILPYTIYRRNSTFLDQFTIFFTGQGLKLENEKGQVQWEWSQFSGFFESPHFFHLYFTSRQFFLIPKETMTPEFTHELRGLLNNKLTTMRK